MLEYSSYLVSLVHLFHRYVHKKRTKSKIIQFYMLDRSDIHKSAIVDANSSRHPSSNLLHVGSCLGVAASNLSVNTGLIRRRFRLEIQEVSCMPAFNSRYSSPAMCVSDPITGGNFQCSRPASKIAEHVTHISSNTPYLCITYCQPFLSLCPDFFCTTPLRLGA